MSHSIAALEQQVRACRAMLALFQLERQQIQQAATSPLAIVRQSLPQKQALLGTLGSATTALAAPVGTVGDGPRHRGLLSELAALLEQLLVIDQENERTVRQRLQRQPSQARPASVAAPAAPSPGPRLTYGLRPPRRPARSGRACS